MTIRDEVARLGFWYHELELGDGVVTGGNFPHSVPATRAILKRVELEGKSVLDIGAMEGFFSILSCRRGAARVMATDRYDYTEKVEFVQRTLDVDYDYAPGLALDEVRRHVLETRGELPEVTIFSGVLYHMFDPMGGLARVRGLVRNGGLVIVETVASVSDMTSMQFDADFDVYGPSTYFIPTTGALGAMLAFVGLQPIDCRYFVFGRQRNLPLCRVALACRAVDVPALSEPLPWYATGDHAWYARYAPLDFGEFLDVEALKSADRARVGYRGGGEFPSRTAVRENPLLIRNFTGRPGLEVDPANTRLRLGDSE